MGIFSKLSNWVNGDDDEDLDEEYDNYVYDEDYECYTCEMDLDEDEMARFLSSSHFECPYYTPGDEYLVVRHQM